MHSPSNRSECRQTGTRLTFGESEARATVAYVRVSSAEQNMDRQLEAVGECDRIFQNKISGSSRAKRTGLTELIGWVRL
ncbi:recombinase family protein [Kocuria carniphila]|uniref:recombinase family protein n=1 Tax=Kocuria carniphila TaxID=262208 RepID=UPI0034DAF7BD